MIGRFPLIVNYHKLSEEAVDKIIDKTLETLRLAYQFRSNWMQICEHNYMSLRMEFTDVEC